MKTKLLPLVVAVLVIVTGAMDASIVIRVAPEGDGIAGRARYGYGDTWSNTGFNAGANPNWAGHWYEYGSGETSNVYMQVSLAALAGQPAVNAAQLRIFVTQCTTNFTLQSLANPSAATGSASQMLSADLNLATIAGGSSGWTQLDVTGYIQDLLANGHPWAVFLIPQVGYSDLRFASADSADSGPELVVSVIPEPGTVGLLLVALGFLLAQGRVGRGCRR